MVGYSYPCPHHANIQGEQKKPWFPPKIETCFKAVQLRTTQKKAEFEICPLLEVAASTIRVFTTRSHAKLCLVQSRLVGNMAD